MPARREDAADRVRILEKAVDSLGDAVRKRDRSVETDLREMQAEMKALKVFLARSMPAFREQFPGIRGKIR